MVSFAVGIGGQGRALEKFVCVNCVGRFFLDFEMKREVRKTESCCKEEYIYRSG